MSYGVGTLPVKKRQPYSPKKCIANHEGEGSRAPYFDTNNDTIFRSLNLSTFDGQCNLHIECTLKMIQLRFNLSHSNVLI